MACVLTPMAGFEVVRKAAAHPDVLIPYGHVSVDEPGVVKEIQTFADAGFKGVKMHRPKYNWDDFGYFPSTRSAIAPARRALPHRHRRRFERRAGAVLDGPHAPSPRT
jgi:hypothetical protein